MQTDAIVSGATATLEGRLGEEMRVLEIGEKAYCGLGTRPKDEDDLLFLPITMHDLRLAQWWFAAQPGDGGLRGAQRRNDVYANDIDS